MNAWKIDATRILTQGEIAVVLADLNRLGKRSVNARMNRAIFRLATCCGLRASEIAGLRVGDVRVSVQRPYIHVSKRIAKGGRARRVPLWWDRGTLDDLEAWRTERDDQGAGRSSPFVCAQASGSLGNELDRRNIRQRFIRACGALGEERTAHLTVHDGRHSFVSHALAGGRTLAEVRDAAGHTNISTTSIYTHVVADDMGVIGSLFGEPMRMPPRTIPIGVTDVMVAARVGHGIVGDHPGKAGFTEGWLIAAEGGQLEAGDTCKWRITGFHAFHNHPANMAR